MAIAVSLSWQSPSTGELERAQLLTPIAIGKEPSLLPEAMAGEGVSPLVLLDSSVSRYHACLVWKNNQLLVSDQGSTNGVLVNGVKVRETVLSPGDRLMIGRYQITISFSLPVPSQQPANQSADQPDFPPAFFQSPLVAVQDLYATGLPITETVYGTIGGGLGSYILADYLRIGGVPVQSIVAIGLEPQPYARYKRLCLNSQIPLHERLRSNSDSCPDNIWGYPSYAWREAFREFGQAKIASALYHLWQVFAEPTLAETYTPKAGNVFDSIDREANRIGWSQIYRYGRVRSLRKTEDGRYAIAYSLGKGQHAFLVSRYVHLAVGYSAIQFLPDLQEYRERTGDFRSVVNAYEDHDYVYEKLETDGGTILLRGRGIVASRIVQRIYEARRKNPHINILHLMRSPKPHGNRYGRAQRLVENHYEFQPFNWPKACWGGDLLFLLESADPQTRQSLLTDWGGTTTASRSDWRRIVKEGLARGWYNITFGEVEKVGQSEEGRTVTHIKDKALKSTLQLEADFIIDATGLDAKILTNPLFADLVATYNLPINFLGRLTVGNDFAIAGMDNHGGRMFASGAATLGGPHAAVDSFLGLQFAGLAIADNLYRSRSPHLGKINGLRSLSQWLKWVFNNPP